MTEGELNCTGKAALSMVATSRLTETKVLSGYTSNEASVTKETLTGGSQMPGNKSEIGLLQTRTYAGIREGV